MTRRLLPVILLAAVLSGCGFALRGSDGLPASLDRVAVDGADFAMVDRLESALSANGASVVDPGDQAAAVLRLLESGFIRDVRSTDADGLATSHTLKYRVAYEVRTAGGDELQASQRLVHEQVAGYDPLRPLQSEQEEALLKAEMQDEIVQQILHRLRRIRQD